MAFWDFLKVSGDHRQDEIQPVDILDNTIKRFMEEPFPGPWKAQFIVAGLGINLGLKQGPKNPVLVIMGEEYAKTMRETFFRFKETIVAHGFGHSFSDLSEGAARLDLCMLRYQWMRLDLDEIRTTPNISALQRKSERQEIDQKAQAILREYPKLARVYYENPQMAQHNTYEA